MIKTLAHGYSTESTQLELSKDMTVFRWFSKKKLRPGASEKNNLSIERVKHQWINVDVTEQFYHAHCDVCL